MIDDYISSILALEFDRIPTEITEKIKYSLGDVLGATVRGSLDDSFRSVQASVEATFSSSGRSTQLCNGMKANKLQAAYSNALASHVLLFDDQHNQTIMHPGSSIFPSLLSISEENKISGKDFLTSAVVSYETALRLAKGLAPEHYKLGFSPTGTVSSVGIAAGIARLLHLSNEETLIALSISSQQMGGTRDYQEGGHNEYAMFLTAGAALNGILSTMMALSGIPSPVDFTRKGATIYKAFSNSIYKDLFIDFGSGWNIPEITYKIYPSSRFCHGPVVNLLSDLQGHHQNINDIGRITVFMDKERTKISDIPIADTRGSAIFSLQYNIAAALLKGKLTLEEFTDSMIEDPTIIEFMKKIKLEYCKDYDFDYPKIWKTKVRIDFKNGDTEETEFDSLTITKPTKEQIKNKFIANMMSRYSRDVTERVWKMIMNLEKLPLMSDLTNYLADNLELK